MKYALILLLFIFISCGEKEIEQKAASSLEELVKIALRIKTEANLDLLIAYSNKTNSTVDLSKEKENIKILLQSFQAKKIIKQKLSTFAEYDPNEGELPGFEEFRKIHTYNIQPSHILKFNFEAAENSSLSTTFAIISNNGKWQFVIRQPNSN